MRVTVGREAVVTPCDHLFRGAECHGRVELVRRRAGIIVETYRCRPCVEVGVVARSPDVLVRDARARIPPDGPREAIRADRERERLHVRGAGRDIDRDGPRAAARLTRDAHVAGAGARVDPSGGEVPRSVDADVGFGLCGSTGVVGDLDVACPVVGRRRSWQRAEVDVGVTVAAVLPDGVAHAVRSDG